MRGLWTMALLAGLAFGGNAMAEPRVLASQADVTTGTATLAQAEIPSLKVIVIDPGHGGTNEGAIGVAGMHEKYLTLQIAQLLADRLREALPGTRIVLTRERDEDIALADRIDIANQLHADLFLSLHFNSSMNPEAIGYESFWVGDFWEADMVRDGIEITDETRAQRTEAGRRSEEFAQFFNHAMHRQTDVLDRGVKPGDYTVLTRAEVPAVVIELAFLSHAQEGREAVTRQARKRYVDALAEAVLRYARSL